MCCRGSAGDGVYNRIMVTGQCSYYRIERHGDHVRACARTCTMTSVGLRGMFSNVRLKISFVPAAYLACTTSSAHASLPNGFQSVSSSAQQQVKPIRSGSGAVKKARPPALGDWAAGVLLVHSALRQNPMGLKSQVRQSLEHPVPYHTRQAIL